jgi:hypothetical protein
VYDVENPGKCRTIPHKVNVNKETRSYEPQDENQEPEETEAYGNEEYDEPHSLEDVPRQEEGYPGVDQAYQNGYSADDAEDLSESQQYTGGESYSVEEQQEDYPETGKAEKEDYPQTGEVRQEYYQETEKAEQDEQTQSYDTDVRREFAYIRQNVVDQEPRLEQAFDENCDDNVTQRYGNSRSAADQPAPPYVEPVDESHNADDQQTRASY